MPQCMCVMSSVWCMVRGGVWCCLLKPHMSLKSSSFIGVGRGFGVALEISQIDQHRFTVANSANCGVTNVTVHRPMSDFLDVEIDTYVKFNQLTTCQTPSLYSKATTHKFSIDYLSQSMLLCFQSSLYFFAFSFCFFSSLDSQQTIDPASFYIFPSLLLLPPSSSLCLFIFFCRLPSLLQVSLKNYRVSTSTQCILCSAREAS